MKQVYHKPEVVMNEIMNVNEVQTMSSREIVKQAIKEIADTVQLEFKDF